MAAVSPSSPRPPDPAAATASVRLDVRAGGGVTSYRVDETGFLLGSVPGCDLRLPGAGMPPVLALVAPQGDRVRLRKLAPIGGLFLNDEPVVDAVLSDGDRIVAGGIEIGVSITAPATVPVVRVRLFDGTADERETVLKEQEETLDRERAELAALRHELNGRAEELGKREEEIAGVRREMDDIRRQLHQRYRQRRDRLTAMQEAVRRAGRRVQEQRRELVAERERTEALRAGGGAYEAEMRLLAGQMTEKAALLQEQEQALRQGELQLEADRRKLDAETAQQKKKLDEERQALQRSQAQHQTDLVRLDRLAATLEQRQRQVQRTALEIDRRYETLQRDTRELEEQAGRLDEWQSGIDQQREEIEQQRRDLDAGRAEVAARAAALEGQQAMLAGLRTRMERLRDEHRRREQALDEQKARQDAAEEETVRRLTEARRLSQELAAEKQLREGQARQLEERKATLESAVAQLRLSHARMTQEAAALDDRRRELEETALRQQEQVSLLEARQREADAERERLRLDRLSLDERQANIGRAEQVMAALQEQLRRRAEELSSRQKALDEQAEAEQAAREAHEKRWAEHDESYRRKDEELDTRQRTFDSQRAELDDMRADLESREVALRGEVQELLAAKEQMASQRQQHQAELMQCASEAERLRQQADVARVEVQALDQQLPELQRLAEESLQRLALAREQLRGYLAEIHAYVRQGRADLDALREGVSQEQRRLDQARDTHRLAVATFRQQLGDWQGQLAELKLSLSHGESRLEQRLAEVEERAQQIDAASRQLAEQADQLQEQERAVVERRQEVDRHLDDMREWYRKKLRELARIEADEEPAGESRTPHPDETPLTTARPGLLSMTGDVEPGDRQLGELMRSLELIDADTLTALLVEARRRRRSLRQLLLQGGYLTLFQLALIEAGNLDGLVLGPVRVIDRLHATPQEAVYRVFDPRHDRECLLRHLAEAEMQDAVRPDEFRQRFAAVVELSHPSIAATWEVLEIAGRPAVLQEWLTGLPSTEWPALSAVPGVWFRLLSQAALGLQTAHQAGLTHGNLQAALVICTSEGVLKLCGLGEPAWLTQAIHEGGDLADDLRALGRCALAWSTPTGERKGARTKPLPESLQGVLRRLCGEDGAEPFGSASELLEALDAAGSSVPPNAAAWERFVKHVREQSGETPLRRSA